MNLMYCGDSNTIDGIMLSLISIIKYVKKPLNVYILSMDFDNHKSLKMHDIKHLEKILKEVNKDSKIKLYDMKDKYETLIPLKNINTRFTPYCMLRLYADMIDDIPDKILYLDYDVLCNKDFSDFYDLDIDSYEVVGVLDYYGSHIYKKNIFKKDYMNSGVLLLNMKKIKETKLFYRARCMCHDRKMLLPDQSALNYLSKYKLIVDRKYNEQISMYDDVVFRHFSTTFKFFPRFKTQTIKPWNVEKLHDVLNIYCFDDVLDIYNKEKRKMYNE